MEGLKSRVNAYIDKVEQLELEQMTSRKTKEQLEVAIKENEAKIEYDSEQLDIVANAINLLRIISDETVQASYNFITASINSALDRIFENSERRIRLNEYTRGGMYPQLEIELQVENGKIRSLKDDSGHGIMQIISTLCILSLIVITGGRRIFVSDETFSGLSAKSRQILDAIIWAFTDIGFQFIIAEHGYIPKGAKVYKFEAKNGTSKIVEEYIQEDGVYLDGVAKNDNSIEGIGMREFKLPEDDSKGNEKSVEVKERSKPNLGSSIVEL